VLPENNDSVSDDAEIEDEPMNSVTDLGWDPGEDHLLVSYKDGTMNMITFAGYHSATAITL
jgi:hypothetical protein